MKRLLIVPLAAALLAGTALAQTVTKETTTTWSADQGTVIREHATTQSYKSFSDPALQPRIGIVLPNTVELHPLPPTLQVPQAETYSYSILNDRPVVVERSTRKVIHTW